MVPCKKCGSPLESRYVITIQTNGNVLVKGQCFDIDEERKENSNLIGVCTKLENVYYCQNPYCETNVEEEDDENEDYWMHDCL